MNTKIKLLLSIFILSFAISGLNAFPSAHDTGFKIGVGLGYPTVLTGGYRFSRDFELNAMFGTNYSSFGIGVNGLILIASPVISFDDKSKDPFPVSIGPQVYCRIGSDYFGLTAHVVARIENTMRTAPLNFFLELGLGADILPVTRFDPTGAIGIRFVFDHPSLKKVTLETDK